ncbi:hypothetical protein AQJ54_04510 [Streptomyces griseorubiginosus]|uniref:Uncharacterized protein n=1 Tax=Streptomyces griseorubiginosus TaxID=67304 RepID=A0A124HZT2_9ACTN|nr:hypothetical protein AQJ54_04510 [Streptomyces griseorubiginosus]
MGGGGLGAGVPCRDAGGRCFQRAGLGVEAQVGGVATEGPGAGVGVTDAEEGVALALDQVVGGDAGAVVGGRVEQGPAGGVTAEGGGVGGGGDGAQGDVEGGGGVGGAVGVGGAGAGGGSLGAVGVDGGWGFGGAVGVEAGGGSLDAVGVGAGGSSLEAVGADGGRDFGGAVGVAADRSFEGAVGIDVGAEGLCPIGLGTARAAGADEGALGAQDAGEGVHDDDGADLVGRVQLNELPGGPFDVPVPLPGLEDLPDEGGLAPLPLKADVEEPGPGDDDIADAVAVEETRAQNLGDPKRRLPGGTGELKGEAGGVVTTATGPGRRHLHRGRHAHVQFPVIDSTTHRAQHGTGELDGGHGTSVWEEGGG